MSLYAAQSSLYADTVTAVTSLDSLLRSRLQTQLQALLDPGILFRALAATSNGQLDDATLKDLVYRYMLTTEAPETEHKLSRYR
jgi:hypothetical protein